MTGLWDISSWRPLSCLLTGRVWDAKRFKAETRKRAGFLKEFGIQSGDPVFIYHNNSLEFLADLFSLWSLGAAAAALNPALTVSELKNLCQFSGPKAILIGPGKTIKADFGTPVLDLSGENHKGIEISPGAQDFKLILYTSGTTSKPKGVVHTRASIEAKIKINIEHFGRGVFRRSLCVLSSHFVAGLFSSILTPLAAGGKVFLYPDPGVKGAGCLGQLIDRHEITMINTVPTLWNIILKASPGPNNKSLELVSAVSAPLSEGMKKAITEWTGVEGVVGLYGTTETGGWNTHSSNLKPGSVGKVLGGEAAVIERDGTIKPEGQGELLLKTPAMMAGYDRRPDLDHEAFQKGWFKTGDTAEIESDGFIFIKGREKTQINRAGIKIIPEEIEGLLETHPAVRAACVFSYPDPVMGEGVAALIEPSEGKTIDFSALRQWCKSRIRTIAVPEKWFSVAEIPRNERGKINRLEIQAKFGLDKRQ